MDSYPFFAGKLFRMGEREVKWLKDEANTYVACPRTTTYRFVGMLQVVGATRSEKRRDSLRCG